MSLVVANKVAKTYRDGDVDVPALRGIDCSIEPASFVAFVGPSGSGKTTLLNMVGCLDKPSSGRLAVLDTDVAALDRRSAADFRGTNIGFLFQEFNLIPVLSAYENIEYPLLMVQDWPADKRRARYGFDFARNLSTNLELHGEWARIHGATEPVLGAGGAGTSQTSDVTSYLLAMRYLTERDTTWIVEYYRNGTGYSQDQMRAFLAFSHSACEQFLATGNAAALERAGALQTSYARANPMRRYVYLRASQKEPFDILHFTPAVTAIFNLDDHSYSLAPELVYTGVTNLELHLRLFYLHGERLTDFGEKQNDRRIELRLRYYF